MNTKPAYDLNSRLYVELIPNDTSRSQLKELVDNLSAQVAGRFIDPSKWHVTVIHFGKVQDVFFDLLAAQPLLTEERFIDALNHYAERSKQVLPSSVQLEVERYDLFGEQHNVLVLRLAASTEIVTAHRQALDYLLEFFESCGLQNIENYMRGNHNFQHALTIKPHLTLVRKVGAVELAKLPLPGKTLQFLPADIAGL